MLRVKQSEFIRDCAKVTVLELILSVNVGRDTSADGDARRVWHDGKNPIPRDSEVIEIAHCNTCLDRHVAYRRIECQNAVETAGINEDHVLSRAGCAIGQTCTARN